MFILERLKLTLRPPQHVFSFYTLYTNTSHSLIIFITTTIAIIY